MDPATPDAPEATEREDRQWGALAHGLSLLGYLVAFGYFIPPLVIYLAFRESRPFVADQAKESLNFQINVVIAIVIGVLLCVTVIGIPIGLPLLILTSVAQLVFVIIASIKAADGQAYRYPISVRFF